MLNLTENQKKWIAALRSGQFDQTTEELEDSYTNYCCLGVGSKVAEANGIQVHKNENGVLIGEDLTSQPEVRVWLGLYSAWGANSIEDTNENCLTNFNDIQCKTFEEIADILETVPGYFVENKS